MTLIEVKVGDEGGNEDRFRDIKKEFFNRKTSASDMKTELLKNIYYMLGCLNILI